MTISIKSGILLMIFLDNFLLDSILSLSCKEFKFNKSSNFCMYKDTDDLSNLPFDVPTTEEIKRSVAVIPTSSWGLEMKRNKSLRVLCIGSSNTGSWYPIILQKRIASLIKSAVINESSYVLIESVSGSDPSSFYHTRFSFEEKPGSIDSWPNIILLEFSVSIAPQWTGAFQLDTLVRKLKKKWEHFRAESPSFLILNLFSVSSFYTTGEGAFDSKIFRENGRENLLYGSTNITENIKRLSPHTFKLDSHGFNRGDYSQPYILAFAKFYQYPMLSLTDCMWPSFVRYFLAGNDTSNQLWPFSEDGRHLSQLGAAFAVDKVILPFFKHEMSSKRTNEKEKASFAMNPVSIYSEDIRMFPREKYAENTLIASWGSWKGLSIFSFPYIVAPTTGWGYLKTLYHERDDNHICYGSTDSEQPARFKIEALYRHCTEKFPCALKLTYIHSWNTSYIGDATCSVFTISPGETDFAKANRSHPVVSNYPIQGNIYDKAAVHGTVPHSHELSANIIGSPTRGDAFYLIECQNIDKPRLSCFASIELLQTSP